MKKIFRKHKKLLARIGSILACLLLVGALALPAFAIGEGLTPFQVVTQYATDYGLNNRAFTNALAAAQNRFTDPEGWLRGLTAVYTGELQNAGDTDYIIIPNTLVAPSGATEAVMPGQTFTSLGAFALSVSQGSQEVYATFRSTVIVSVVLYKDTYSSAIVSGTFSVVDVSTYETLFEGALAGQEASEQGVPVTLLRVVTIGTPNDLIDLNDYDVSLFFGVSGQDFNAGNVARILLNNNNATPFSPQSLITGYIYGENFGGGGGATEEELQQAYQNGYAQGEQVGLQTGYDNGYNSGYNVGFEVAAQRDFGADIIGETLSKPMEMLRDFTIVRLPSGIDITLGHVASALIALVLVLAFLKIYAGG